MAKKMKIRVDEKDLDVREAEFEISREEWNEYRLLDGGKVRVKTTVARVFRVLDNEGKPAYTKEGDPYLIVRHKTEIVAIE